MKAIVCTAYGTPDVLKLKEVEKPEPKDNEVLIKVQAAAVTSAGLIGRKGKPVFTRLFSGLTKPKNDILGMELAGEIEAVGKNVSLFKKGDQIFGITGMTLGSNAEYKCLSQDAAIIHKPINLDCEESVAVVEGGLTALNFLKRKGKIKNGQKVLIYGASGSVGTASIQLAKYFGAEVTGVCSTTNVNLVKSLGADMVIDYTKEDFTQNEQTYDIIFDTVGKSSFPLCKNSLKSNGIYLDAAGLSTVFHMLWTSLFSHKKAILTATYVRPTKVIRQELAIVKELVEAGEIRPVIDRRYPLEQTAKAHRYVETGRKKGNVVITPE
ncbi:NAD(P)-dependent alcohol dehydrogenase [Flagellimonas aquimarina]|uniref:NAD(P)-dependent alcohol dehydrogenase n=1 Tax=Flagellimonas aquimarina TaxID=2201895 RepID=A0A316L3A5_9FLAO|nr:NAD(P)-dependent alcohol dehydrogenase [Allomuricauda koreensis]PWL38703.1 NAD(P)-dependent alcohol dehydrogenase [Allomuricauda koreensis]